MVAALLGVIVGFMLALLAAPIADARQPAKIPHIGFLYTKRLVDLAAKSRLPAIHDKRAFTQAGDLMSYGTNLANVYRRAATFVDKIPKGAKRSDVPVEQPTKFELVINLKTAKALGLAIPPSELARADEVIE